MKTVTVLKSDLLHVLRKNRGNHRRIFLEAQTKFREEVVTELDHMLEDARVGRRISLRVGLTAPMDQTEDYDAAISMLEMCVDDKIELSESDHRCFVLDQWHWHDQWLLTNSAYAAIGD